VDSISAVQLVALLSAALGGMMGARPDLTVRQMFQAKNLESLRFWLHGGVRDAYGPTYWEKELAWQPPSPLMAAAHGCAGEVAHPSVTKELAEPHLLMTGVTGFLGPQLLLESFLLARQSDACPARPSDGWTRIVCLCRASRESVLAQLQSAVGGADAVDVESIGRVIRVIHADLECDRLGISPDDCKWLCSINVVAVLHNGARVDHVQPYPELRRANVQSADALIALLASAASSMHKQPVPFLFVSSFSARMFEDSRMASARTEQVHGYAATKWVAEQRLQRAAGSGIIRLTIARLGLVGPHSLNGRSNSRDWLHLFMKAVHETQMLPRLDPPNPALVLLPVDVAAENLVAILQHSVLHEPPCRILHMDGLSMGCPLISLAALLASFEGSSGDEATPLRRDVEYGEWCQCLRDAHSSVAAAALAVLPPPTTRASVAALPFQGGLWPELNSARMETQDALRRIRDRI
jgi:thioester reductase-like protein